MEREYWLSRAARPRDVEEIFTTVVQLQSRFIYLFDVFMLCFEYKEKHVAFYPYIRDVVFYAILFMTCIPWNYRLYERQIYFLEDSL